MSTRRRLAELTGALGLVMTRPGTAGQVLQRSAEVVREHLDVAIAQIWTLESNGEQLTLAASAGGDGPTGSLRRIAVGSSEIGEVAASRERRLTRSFAGWPLLFDDELVGVLATFANRPMSELEGEALDTVASGLALLISRQRGAEAMRRRALELARTAAALERSNRELSQFAYVTSHDLKAPLRGIANLAQWIEEDLGDGLPADVAKHLVLLRGRVHRMEALIDGILQYSRVGRLDRSVEEVPVPALLAEIIDLLELPEGVRVELAPGLPVLHTARLPLFQVFMNLITNAVRHARADDGLVRVSGRPLDGAWEFAVTDNGPGIPERFRDRVWGVFQRLEARDEVEGTGIGLAIVRKIVEGMGGEVAIGAGDGDTPGARFTFTWPTDLEGGRD